LSSEEQSLDAEAATDLLEQKLRENQQERQFHWWGLVVAFAVGLILFSAGLWTGSMLPTRLAYWLALFFVCSIAIPMLGLLFLWYYRSRKED